MLRVLKGLLLLASVFILSVPAWANPPRKIPRSDQVQTVFLNYAFILNPCADLSGEANNDEESKNEILKMGEEARKGLPPHTCDNPKLVEKLFRAKFLLNAIATVVPDPWNVDTRITPPLYAKIDRCKDTACLNRALDTVIAKLSPIYQNSPEPKVRYAPDGKHRLCSGKWASIPINTALAFLSKKQLQEMAGYLGYATEDTQVNTCTDSHGKLMEFFTDLGGVDSPVWLFRVAHNKATLLFSTEDSGGTYGVLESSCNGWPDLITHARSSAGADLTYYRYDGTRYQQVYSYTEMPVGSFDSDNNWSIALPMGDTTPVSCH